MSRKPLLAKEGHDFSNTFRLKPTQRTRLFYLASSAAHEVRVPLYGATTRKENDKRDAYREFARLLKRGDFLERRLRGVGSRLSERLTS